MVTISRAICSGAILGMLAPVMLEAQWTPLFNQKNLDGWESAGDGVWSVTSDGVVVGQRDFAKQPEHQAWLYSKKEFEEFDLHVEWWTRFRGNSGVSIRDTSRGRYSFGKEYERNKTPSHIGYEIQISNGYESDEYGSGSIYLFAKAKTGALRMNDWNAFDIESRKNRISVRLNGQLVAEHPGEAGRPLKGPIGFQLHDRNSIIMLRNCRIREVQPR